MTQAAMGPRERVGRRFDVSWQATRSERDLPLPWRRFIDYCDDLGHGEIERLKIQDGVPVLAELTREKVKFT